MKISVDAAVYNAGLIKKNQVIELKNSLLDDAISSIRIENCFAYRPFVNCHDHLIGNWYPPARGNDLYPNAHIWVSEMKETASVKERDIIFRNTIPMNFLHGRGRLLALLGAYKNIFSGVTVVQDHAPRQKKGYYALFPINIIQNYRQCHSLTLGNFWGDNDPVKEWESTEGKEPFIIHLAEGLDKDAESEFSRLKELHLLQPNTLIIHGISLSEQEIRECAETGTSICWCPYSNLNLIGKTLNIDACLKYGVNVVLGTDSTLSGSISLLHEIRFVCSKFPHIDLKTLYDMITRNAAKALFLPEKSAILSEKISDSLLLIKAKHKDPLENLLAIDSNDIILLMHKSVPIYGSFDLLDLFTVNDEDYFFFTVGNEKRFVIGHPDKIIDEISRILGYHKVLPYLPFQE